jgi:hypothetical protein
MNVLGRDSSRQRPQRYLHGGQSAWLSALSSYQDNETTRRSEDGRKAVGLSSRASSAAGTSIFSG